MNNNNINTVSDQADDLINRYVYAVVRRLPISMRNDVDKELHSIISDTLEARCGEVQPTEKDVKVVLTELGTPSELSAKYDPNGERSLISKEYFPTYFMVLKICLACTFFGLLVAGIINLIIDPPRFGSAADNFFGIWQFISSALGTLVSAAVSVFGGVTLIFAFMQDKGVNIDGSTDELSRLPAVPENSAVIKRSECIVGIVFSTLFLLLMCFAPQLMAVYNINVSGGTSSYVPILNTTVVKGLWPFWVAFFVLGAGRDLWRMFIGTYNVQTLVVTIVADVLSALIACYVFLTKNIMNPEAYKAFLQAASQSGETLSGESEVFMAVFFRGFAHIFLAAMIFALVIDIATTAVKTAKYSK